MSSFYTSEFDKLFNTTGNDKMVYHTDMIYGYKDLDTGFKSMVNLQGYLNNVSSLSINRVTSESVNNVIEGKSSTLVVDNANFKGADKDALVIEYTATQPSANAAERIYADLVASLGNPNDATVARELAQVPTDHRKAYTFMENIILSMCNWKYENVKNELLKTLRESTSMLSDIKTAGEEMRIISKPKEASLMTNLHTTCSQAIQSMVKNQAPSTFLLKGFAEGPTFSNNRFRTTLREAMYSNLILREYKGTNIKDEVLMYLRRLLVEVYIVSFYPYIHFLYINELLKKFQASGNFINMRVGALVRVAFTINTLLSYFEVSGSLLQETTRTQRLSTIITQWAETLKNYMTAIARVEFENKDTTIKNVISDLHTMSSKVTTQAMTVEELKESIKSLQLQMRSIMSLFKSINKERSRKATQYGLLVFLLILIVIVSAVMIVFDLYKNYLLYSLVGLCSLVIIVRIVFSIIEMVKLNK